MSQTIRRPARIALCAAFAAALLVGCGEDVPTRAGTIDDPSGTAAGTQPGEAADTSGKKEEEEPEGSDPSAAGRQLTKAEAKAALPRVGVLPAGWSVDPDDTLTKDDDSDSSDDVVTPKRCAVVFETLEKLDATRPSAKQGVTFMAGALGPWLGVQVFSYDEEVSDTQFATVLNALADCPKFSVDDGEPVTRFNATSMSFPNYGEESLALRLTGTADGFTFGMNYVAIRAGHNTVGLVQMSVGGASKVGPLKKAAKVTMSNLAAG